MLVDNKWGMVMAIVIAVGGEPDSGKTTCTGLILRSLMKAYSSPVLAIDASAETRLANHLGMNSAIPLDEVITYFEDTKINIPSGVFKSNWLEFKLNHAISESVGLDLVSLGCIKENKCNCFSLNALDRFLRQLEDNYHFIVINDAIEFLKLKLSVFKHIDELFMISSPNISAFHAISLASALVQRVNIAVGHYSLLINKAPVGGLDPAFSRALVMMGCEPFGSIPVDKTIACFNKDTTARTSFPERSDAVVAMDNIVGRILSTPSRGLE